MTRNISLKTKTLARLLADRDYDYLEQLREIREAQGMSVADVAAKLGVSEDAIHKIEAPDANPTLNTLRQYALAIEAVISREVQPYEEVSELSSSSAKLGQIVVSHGKDSWKKPTRRSRGYTRVKFSVEHSPDATV